jgi:hypothetical protein
MHCISPASKDACKKSLFIKETDRAELCHKGKPISIKSI